jgi:hypothetical protein
MRFASLDCVRSIACAVLVLAACARTGGRAAAPGELDSVDLAPSPGWPDAVAVRSVPSSFRTAITRLDVDARRKVWLLRDEFTDPSQLAGSPVLERYAPTGHLERRITFPAHSAVSGFVIHPSGALTVFVLRDDDGDLLYDLELRSLSPDGEEVATSKLQEIPGPRENLFYDQNGVHELAIDRPFQLSSNNHVEGVADGEGLYLVCEWTYGFKLYRLDSAKRRLWGVQLMPANIGTLFPYSPSLVARDGDAVYVTAQIFEDDVHVYGEHFGRPALASLGSYDALVQRFGADGSFAGVRLFGGVAVDYPTAMTVHEGVVLISGAARITKSDSPNRTMEWDIAIMRGSVEASSALEYRTIDLARDDFAWALAEGPRESLIVAGRTDYVQVDTNSEVENGKGLLLTLGPDLSRQAVLELPMPRDVQVRAVRMLAGGDLLLAGTRDGPLTHTERSMTHNDGFWGVVQSGE